MEWLEIKKIDDFKIIKELAWDHAFIKEIYTLSPTFEDVNKNGVIADGINPNMFLLIFFASGETNHPIGIEFFFINVEEMTFLFQCNITPELNIYNSYIELDLSGIIRAKKLKYHFIDESYLGDRIEYGKKEFYYDKTLFPNG